MQPARRRFLQLAAGATGAAALPALAKADAPAYPAQPVHVILGFPAGGSSDVIGRLVTQSLAQRLGQPFVFDNRLGAGSNIGTEMVAKAAPDGYTLLWATSANAINASLYAHLNFDFIRDLAPVAGTFRVPNVMEVHPSVPVKTVAEFIAYAKANPGKLNFCSGGIGTTAHLSGELFKSMTGVDIRHVPYRGSAPALIDLISGEVQVMFDLLATSIEHIRAGRLRPLAVTTAARSDALPDLPTVAEAVPGYEASTWNGLSAPRATPAAVIEKLNGAVNAALADPAITARLVDLGAAALPLSPAQFGDLVAADTRKWGQVIKFAGIAPT